IAARVALATAWYGAGRALRPPAGGAVSYPAGRGIPARAHESVGFPVFAGRAIRADVAERVAGRVAAARLTEGDVADAPEATALRDAEVASWLGCPTREVRRILETPAFAALGKVARREGV
ncbi:MAG: ATP-dependent helicase, partial [Labilithrix sp.]|nr:ATP-dependent helicase [Labilithrix sp.]